MGELILIKITRFFLENPYNEVYLRELARKLRLSPFATKKYVDLLIKEGLIKEERKANLRYFSANVSNLFFKHLKISLSINSLLKSSLISYLKENIPNVSSIVLFGSTARGEDSAKSDIDLTVIGGKKSLNLKEFESKIKKEINMHVFSWSQWNKKAEEDKAFYYEVINQGMPLYGELPIIK